jgi:hypothetical protein
MEVVSMYSKAEYVEKLSAQLVEWDRQLEDFNYKADNAGAEMRTVYFQEINNLMQQRQVVELKLQKIGAASDATWQEMKAGGDNAWDEVRTDLHDAIVSVK